MCKSLETLKANLSKNNRRLSKVTIKNIVNANCFDKIELGYYYDGYEIHKGSIIENPVKWFNEEYNMLDCRIYNVTGNMVKVSLTVHSNLWYYLTIDLSKDYSKSLHTEEVKEVATTQELVNEPNNTTEGITVEFNEEKHGIEISFASKELATEEIRTAIKSVGFRYYAKFQKWISKQTPEAMELVNTLFNNEIQEFAAEVETIEVSENEIIDEVIILNENNETIEVLESIKPYSKDTLKYVNSICETIIEFNWELQEIKIMDDNGEPCIWGLVKKSNGLTEWEGLYAPSYERTELQEVFNCLNSRIVKDITIDGIEELKELSTLQEVPTNAETIDNSKLIIFIEGEGNTPELKTNDIVKATENLNDRIMKEYNCEYGGYSKTWITLTLNGNNYRFRYDVDKTMRLTTNIIKFMLEQETAEYHYTMNNINDFSWLNPEEYEKEALETIELLADILSDNNINITIENDPFQRALNTIEDNNLYEINADSKTVISDNRYIKNIACNGLTVVTGCTIRELLQEGHGIDIIRLKPLRMDINIFMEGIKKHDTKQIFSLFPTAIDKAIENIKFMDRLQIELNRATAAV